MMKLTIKEIKKIIQEEMKDLRFPLGTGISDEGTNDWIKHIMKIIDKQDAAIFELEKRLKAAEEMIGHLSNRGQDIHRFD